MMFEEVIAAAAAGDPDRDRELLSGLQAAGLAAQGNTVF